MSGFGGPRLCPLVAWTLFVDKKKLGFGELKCPAIFGGFGLHIDEIAFLVRVSIQTLQGTASYWITLQFGLES
jgi:hypothetical protein